MLTSSKTPRGGGGPAQTAFWARPLHAKTVVTAQTGIKKSQRAGNCCLGVGPYWVGCNRGGRLVKSDTVEWQLTPDVYCSKLDRVLLLNREAFGSNGVVW